MSNDDIGACMRSVSTSSISFALSLSHFSEKLLPFHAPSPVGTAWQSEQTSQTLWDRWMHLTKATIRTDFSPSHQALFPAGGCQDHFCSSVCKWAAGLAQYPKRIPRAHPHGVEAEEEESQRNNRVLSSVWASSMTILIKRRGTEVSASTQDLSHTYTVREMLVISQRPAEEELAGNDKAKVLRERVYWKEIITRAQMSSLLHNTDEKDLEFSTGNNGRPLYTWQLAI